MQNTKGYNGWKNYETWNANLWLGETGETFDNWSWYAIKEYFHERFVYENRFLAEVGPLQDMIDAALSEIDWYEVAESYNTED